NVRPHYAVTVIPHRYHSTAPTDAVSSIASFHIPKFVDFLFQGFGKKSAMFIHPIPEHTPSNWLTFMLGDESHCHYCTPIVPSAFEPIPNRATNILVIGWNISE